MFFFFNDTATTEIYTLSLHDALPISLGIFPRLAPDLEPVLVRVAADDRRRLDGGDELAGLASQVLRALEVPEVRRARQADRPAHPHLARVVRGLRVSRAIRLTGSSDFWD